MNLVITKYLKEMISIHSVMVFHYNIALRAISDEDIKELTDTLDANVSGVKNGGVEFLRNLLFIHLVSQVELFLSEIIKCVVSKHPKKIGEVNFPLTDIIDKSKDELIENAAEQYLNRIMYKKPLEYLDDISNILSFNSNEFIELWRSFIEFKLRRDLGVHNDWKVSSIYFRKAKEAGIDISDVSIGDLLYPEEEYFKNSIEQCTTLVSKIGDHCIAKFK